MGKMRVMCVGPYCRVEPMLTLAEKADREVGFDACCEAQGEGQGQRKTTQVA